MKKIVFFLVCCLASSFVFSQDKKEPTAAAVADLTQSGCDVLNICAQPEDETDYGRCVQQYIENCGSDMDLEVIIGILDKKRSLTTGVKNTGWEKILEGLLKVNKVEIDKKTTGIAVVIKHKITKAVLVSVPLAPVTSKTFAASSTKRINTKEIDAFIKTQTPSNTNAITLVKLFLKSCSFSVSVK
jgi:hypothetical protein